MRFCLSFCKMKKKTEKWRKTQLTSTDFAEQNEEKDFQNEEKFFLIVVTFF